MLKGVWVILRGGRHGDVRPLTRHWVEVGVTGFSTTLQAVGSRVNTDLQGMSFANSAIKMPVNVSLNTAKTRKVAGFLDDLLIIRIVIHLVL